MRRAPSELGLIAFFVLALIAVTIGLTSRQVGDEPETRAQRSIRSARPGGWKGFATLLQRQGIPTVALERPPADWPDSGSLVISGPVFISTGALSGPWSSGEARQAIEWIERGGTLLRFDDEWSAVEEEFGLTLDEPATRRGSQMAARKTDTAPDTPTAPDDDEERSGYVSQPAAWLAGVYEVKAPDLTGLETLPHDAVSLLHVPDAENRFVASVHPRGKGFLVLVHSGAFVDNAHLTHADNARFAVQVVQAFTRRRPGTVYFDEYHQGFASAGKSIWDLLGLGFRRALVHLALVLILAFLVAGKRFGLPEPLPTRSRTSAEYIASVADLYRRARRRDAALETLFLRFRRDLCRTADLSLDSMDEIVARQVTQIQGLPEQKAGLIGLMSECRRAIELGPKQFSESQLVALTQAIETARKELRIVGRK